MQNYILFKNATIITSIQNPTIQKQAYLGISSGKIVYISQTPPLTIPKNAKIYNASNWIVCPGLVNAHAHTPMTVLRGYRDDLSLSKWLEYIWPAEEALTESDYYYSSQLGIAEMLSYGTTSISDMYRSSHVSFRSALDSKIKANICESVTCPPGQSPSVHDPVMRSLELIRSCQNYDDGRIKFDTSIQSQFQTTPETWGFIAETAKKLKIGIHMHIAETKQEVENCKRQYEKTPIELFEEFGVFESRCIAAHGIYLSDQDIELLSQHQATIVHDPQSNLKCCCGFANLKPLIEKGINIALGTDGVCSNNTGDLFETMKFTALNQKMINNDPCFADAASVLRMAVTGGLISQGREHESGSLTPGLDADLMVLDTNHPGLTPCTNPISALVYAAHGGHVVMTMVRGEILYEKGEYKSIDIERVRYEVNRTLTHFHQK